MASHLPIVDCMSRTTVLETVRRKFALLRPLLNERLRRHWAACEALTLERGGVTLVAQATGLSRTTITAGLHELKHPQDDAAAELPPERCRHAGASLPACWPTGRRRGREKEGTGRGFRQRGPRMAAQGSPAKGAQP